MAKSMICTNNVVKPQESTVRNCNTTSKTNDGTKKSIDCVTCDGTKESNVSRQRKKIDRKKHWIWTLQSVLKKYCVFYKCFGDAQLTYKKLSSQYLS